MRGRRLGLGRPVVAVPVDRVRRRLAGHALPPDVAVVGLGAVGEDRVARDHVDRVRVRARAGAGRDAEEPGLGVDRVQPAVLAELHPGDVVADRLDLPARQRRDHHRQVGLAAGARERPGDVLDLALRRGELEDQHVLGEPALVARHHRGDPQREALLARAARCRRSPSRRTRSRASRGSGRCTCSRRCTATGRRPRRRPAARRPSAGTARSRRRRRARRAPPGPSGS